ncbi:NAD(P)/FAD-dependent oxidoreductase [Pseudonocardia nigra]|uniref:NAD(P)/FAD-dependent oxidoreductase n=1 Tax=Pseudonocardia nigra TaxID=1921578 RepID=UPI001C5E4272|nr:FAD-dependent oxidoreductase [Pseudonocardia nigra]
MTGQPEHVVVVGAGLGGLRTAEQLRSAGFQGRISLVGAEPHPPYDRPPLSKQVLTGEWAPERARLAAPDALEDLGVRTHLGLRAVALRSHEAGPGHEVELSDGATLHSDALVVATGFVPRTLPGQLAQVHTLRTLEDAVALRGTLERVGSLLVVGGGFIGAEVASAARARDIAVTVLEALPVPSVHALGPEVGALAARLLTEGGVALHTGALVAGFVEAGDGVCVELADGTQHAADAAVVGIGGVPDLGWLDGTGLDVRTGMGCGPTGRVHGLAAAWAVGDVAVWDDPVHGDRHRNEHWTSAGDQAAVVARDILGAQPPPPAVPYFWSDQFGLKIQLIGRPDVAGEVVALHGAGLDGGPVRGTVVGYLDGEHLAAVAGFGAARFVARYRPLVAARATRTETEALAATLNR